MRIPHALALSVFAVAVLARVPSVAAAETALPPAACTNLTAPECDAITALFKDAYVRASAQPVVMLEAAADGERAQPPATADILDVAAVRLATKIHVRATLRRPDGVSRHSVEMTAASLDDMPPVAERISHALVHRTGVEHTQSLGTITRTEATRPNRVYSEKVIGIKTGLVQPLSKSVDFETMMTLQFDARFEGENYFLEFGAGLAIPSGESGARGLGGLFAEFGGSYYLNQNNMSPYVGAGISPRLLFTSSDGGMRAAVYGQAGLMFMRFSSTRLYTELRVTQNLMGTSVYKEFNDGFLSGGETVTTYPTEVGANVGIGW